MGAGKPEGLPVPRLEMTPILLEGVVAIAGWRRLVITDDAGLVYEEVPRTRGC